MYTKERINLDKMHSTVINYINEIVQLNDNERLFIDKFYDAGEHLPELLFDEEEQIERLKAHPMALWKLKNRRKEHDNIT